MNTRKNGEILVNISNLTTNTVAIALLAELQPVKVDEAVYHKLQETPKSDLFKEVTIESTLSPEKNAKIKELLLKHDNVFSKDETDIGLCDVMKHRNDLPDETPFKQKHRCIPPAMTDEVRAQLEQICASGVIRKCKSP